MASRRFEFVGSGSAKFWEVSVAGRELSVRFGRIGTDGQTKLKPFADEKAALAEADKLVREKVGKGYKEVAGEAAAEAGGLTPEQWWARLEETEWLKEVGPKEAKRIRAAFQGLGHDVSEAFLVLGEHGYDAECIENDGDYSKYVVPSYRDASGGALPATKLEDEVVIEEERAVVSFEVRGRTFKKELEQLDDYVADDFHDFMNGVLAKLGEKRRFFILPGGDQIGRLVCVRPATYRRAQRLGLIPAGGEGGEEDE